MPTWADAANRARRLARPPPEYVLIVDDDPDVRLLLTTVLLGDQWDIRSCGTTDTAWLHMLDRAPQLVLLDRELPDGDGLDVLARMRAEPALQAVPVILTSGHRMGEMDPGPELSPALLPKPFTLEELWHAVATALSG
jgi:DNA-binding response OmpR family regulator